MKTSESGLFKFKTNKPMFLNYKKHISFANYGEKMMNKDQGKKMYMFKIVLIGDLDVRKSELRDKYFGYNKDFTSFEDRGTEFAIKRVKSEELNVVFQIWDLQ